MPPARREICDCGTLESASKEPHHPIRWDKRMNEYHIVHGEPGHASYMQVYFCPFCGGRTPPFRRSSCFAHVSDEESTRIRELFRGLQTVSDVLDRFGKPDAEHEFGLGVRKPETDDKPERGDFYRTLVYKNLSQSADIYFDIGLNDQVKGSWMQKYIGEPKSA
jgi:hypothetical protein